ncbi:uncharacterized protein LOC119745688 isoform X1 [Patiria miniata]|uniref:DDE Tnp4 domain-containing protein n=1 Tax=Patiria miniata TaxID=46514 RepID=A0A914BPE9_PATMI|nr:uncharacterized protein LOC119745688 isoform X1 [Patiria miniata]
MSANTTAGQRKRVGSAGRRPLSPEAKRKSVLAAQAKYRATHRRQRGPDTTVKLSAPVSRRWRALQDRQGCPDKNDMANILMDLWEDHEKCKTDHSKSTPCRHDARRVSGSAHASHSSHTTSTSKQHGHAENSKTLRKCLGFHGWKDVCYMEPLVKEITGVSMATFYLLLEHLSLETHPVRGSGLSAENSLLVFLMKLKLNTPFKHLAAQFSVAPSTLEQVFLLILTTISDLTSDLIQWPQKSVIQSTMPSFIKRSFPNCRLILDCLEIETDAPSHLFTQLRMISRSDSSFKAKALIGLTPNGYICFISQLFGGSISYPQLSEENSLKNLLDSGDEVLSLKPDRHLSSIHGIRVHNQPIWPQFSKHSSRFRDDADSLNRHFDKLQQQLRTFSILRSKVSLNLLQYLDSVLQVCAVLSNLEAMPSGDA